jgi:hypothetical protein
MTISPGAQLMKVLGFSLILLAFFATPVFAYLGDQWVQGIDHFNARTGEINENIG